MCFYKYKHISFNKWVSGYIKVPVYCSWRVGNKKLSKHKDQHSDERIKPSFGVQGTSHDLGVIIISVEEQGLHALYVDSEVHPGHVLSEGQ
jgi:hypothetical protein